MFRPVQTTMSIFFKQNSRKLMVKVYRGTTEAISPSKTYESNFIQHDFLQFEKQHWRYQAFLLSIVLSQ